WLPMRTRMEEIAAELNDIKYSGNPQQLAEAQKFLSWLAKDNFTLMGYRRYNLETVDGDHIILQDTDSSLGLMRRSINKEGRLVSSLPEVAQTMTFDDTLLLLTKTNTRSRVQDRKSTRLNSSHVKISYAVFCLK